mmetsp:Transcript_19476/g.57738  ORF Transcript_19476/g.57738 Transcript_19476/m.57738 type:complete len:222 (+) Transcript_19476:171-836(+)
MLSIMQCSMPFNMPCSSRKRQAPARQTRPPAACTLQHLDAGGRHAANSRVSDSADIFPRSAACCRRNSPSGTHGTAPSRLQPSLHSSKLTQLKQPKCSTRGATSTGVASRHALSSKIVSGLPSRHFRRASRNARVPTCRSWTASTMPGSSVSQWPVTSATVGSSRLCADFGSSDISCAYFSAMPGLSMDASAWKYEGKSKNWRASTAKPFSEIPPLRSRTV